jgi:hypothetical protein
MAGDYDGGTFTIQTVTENVGGSVLGDLGGNVGGSVGSVGVGGITSSTFAVGALDAVWSTAARTLTAGTNIVLAKGTGLTGLNDITAAAVLTAILAGVLKGSYTIQDVLKDIAALSGSVTNTGADYTIPATGWGSNNTKMSIADNGSGNRTVTRS